MTEMNDVGFFDRIRIEECITNQNTPYLRPVALHRSSFPSSRPTLFALCPLLSTSLGIPRKRG
jgi:hypothetical protein